jgi:hypothetical protein
MSHRPQPDDEGESPRRQICYAKCRNQQLSLPRKASQLARLLAQPVPAVRQRRPGTGDRRRSCRRASL